MSVQQAAELISLYMTVPTIILSMAVVFTWAPSIKLPPQTAKCWFILGVAIGFAGSALDNLYWAVPWTADFLGLAATGALIKKGIYFNIFFRQTLGIAASYCHLKAAQDHSLRKTLKLNTLLLYANLCGVAYSAFIMFLYLKR